MLKKIEKIAISSTKQAGKVLLKEFKKFDRAGVKLKAHHEIVTKADLISEKLILRAIRKNFPAHQILSEESGKTAFFSDYLWIVDPLDGTTNFSIHNPLWSVSIAVAYRQEIILGVIYVPILDELFVATKGAGAKRNKKRIKVSSITNEKAINTFCHGRDNKYISKALKYATTQKLNGLDCRQLGSAAIELAYVASGRIESIMIPGAKSWDVAAGILLVREADGWVTDFSGQEWSLKSKNMLASNKRVHRNILKQISR